MVGTTKPLGNMIIGIDLDNSKFTSSMTAVQRSIRSSSAEMKAQMGVFTASGKTVDSLKAKHDGLTKSLTLQEKNMQFLKQRYDEASNGGKNYNATVARLQDQINKSVGEQARLRQELGNTDKAYVKASSSATIFRDKLVSAGDKVKSTGENMTKAFAPAAGAMTLGLGYAIKSASDFESEMSNVKSVMNPGDVAKYSGALEHLAIVQGYKTKYSATEAAQAEAELVKAGVSVSDIMNGALAGSLNLATAGELNLKDAAEIASTALNAFRADHLSVAKAADILAGAANASATDVGELKFSLSAVSAVASGVGLTFHDTATALAVFAQNGLKGQDAGTSLKTMLSNLTPMTNTAAAEFENLGLMTVNTQAAMQALRNNGVKPLSTNNADLVVQLQKLAANLSGSKLGSAKATKEFYNLAESTGAVHSAFYQNNGQLKSMSEIASILQSHLHNLNGEQRQQALYTIFGSDAIRGANILYREGAKGVTDMATAMDKIKAADVAKQRMDNFKGTLEQLRGSLETVGITIGEADLPMLKWLTNDLTNVLNGFNALSPSMQHFIAGSLTVGTVGLGAATGLGAMMTVIGSGMSVTGKLIGGLGTLKTALIGTKVASEGEAAVGLASTASKVGLLASALPLLTNPITLTVAGLAALGLGAYAVYRHMNDLQDASTKTADSMLRSHDALQKEINTFDDLRTRSLLTRAELGKYIDLQNQLNKATNPAKVKDLKDQMEQLRQKSGLSNAQLKTMAGLSVDLAKKIPGSTDAVTKEGKAYAYSTSQMNAYNKAKLAQTMDKYQQAYDAARSNEVKIQNQLAKSQSDLTKNVKSESFYRNLANQANMYGYNTLIKKYSAQSMDNKLTYQERMNAAETLHLLQNHGTELYKKLSELDMQNGKLRETISHDKSQLGLANQIADKMTHIDLTEAGINDQKHKGLYAVALEMTRQQSVLDRLRDQHNAGKLNTAEYNNAVKKVQDQINKLNSVWDKVKNITGSTKILNITLSKDIVKQIHFTGDTLTDARSINQALAQKVYKYVAVGVQMPAYKQVQLHGLMYGHATGAQNLPQAETAMVGEQGREFVHDPAVGTYLADGPSIVNLSRGSSVLKNADTERLGSALGLPGFAGGVGNYFDQLLGKTNSTVMLSLAQLPSAVNGLTDVLGNLINNMVNKQLMAGNPGGSGVARWAPQVALALAMNGLSTSPAMIAKVLRQINTESGGNPAAMQHGYTDINSLRGDLAKGLMQTISATFNAYKLPGHGDIWNGFDNMLAALNYAKNRYGPSLSALGNGHGYANGGFSWQDQMAHISEGNKAEMILPLTDKTRSIQLMQQALAYMSNNQSGSAVVAPMLDTGRMEDLLTQNNQLMQAFMQLVDQKPTGITPQAVYQANKQVNDQNTRNRNLALGVVTVS